MQQKFKIKTILLFIFITMLFQHLDPNYFLPIYIILTLNSLRISKKETIFLLVATIIWIIEINFTDLKHQHFFSAFLISLTVFTLEFSKKMLKMTIEVFRKIKNLAYTMVFLFCVSAYFSIY